MKTAHLAALAATAACFTAVGCKPDPSAPVYTAIVKKGGGTRSGSVSLNSQSSSTRVAYATKVHCTGCSQAWPELVTIPHDQPGNYTVDAVGTAGEKIVAVTQSSTSPWVIASEADSSIRIWGDPHEVTDSSGRKSVQWEPHKSPGLDSPEASFVTTAGDVFVLGQATGADFAISTADRQGTPKASGATLVGGALPGGAILSSALSIAPQTVFVALGSADASLASQLTRAFVAVQGSEPKKIMDVSGAMPDASWTNGTSHRVLAFSSEGEILLLSSRDGAAPTTVKGPRLPAGACRAAGFDASGNPYVSVSLPTGETTLYGLKTAALSAIGSIPIVGGALRAAPEMGCGISMDASGGVHVVTVGRVEQDENDVLEYASLSPDGALTGRVEIQVGLAQ